MNSLDSILKAVDKMSDVEKAKFIPTLIELYKYLCLHNEGIQRKNTFTAQFTTVVGVVFGVLAAFNSIGQNIWADVFYMAGIFCCGVCLVLCVICLCKPIYDNSNHKEDAANRVYEEMIKALDLEIVEEEQTKREKKRLPFKKLRIAAYVLFAVSISCVLVKMCILFYSTYF